MKLPLLLLSSVLAVGCASESAWKVHDAHGWPVQSYARLGASGVAGASACDDVARASLVAPDAIGYQHAWQCGVTAGWRGRDEIRQNNIQVAMQKARQAHDDSLRP